MALMKNTLFPRYNMVEVLDALPCFPEASNML